MQNIHWSGEQLLSNNRGKKIIIQSFTSNLRSFGSRVASTDMHSCHCKNGSSGLSKQLSKLWTTCYWKTRLCYITIQMKRYSTSNYVLPSTLNIYLKLFTSSTLWSYPARIILAAFRLAAHLWWTFPDIAVGGPKIGKLPRKGSAFLTAEGSSKSSDAMSSPAYAQTYV